MIVRLALCAALVAACGPKPDPDTARRLSAIEAQLAQQRQQLDELRAAQNTPELGAILDNLQDLTARLVKVESTRGGGAVAAARPVRREPDRAAVYAVPIANSPTYGSPKAKVTLVMAMDFACPFCRKAFDTVEDLRKKYGADLRVVYKAMIVHPQVATHAAIAACAAYHQGKWHELAELLWTKSFDARDFADTTIDKLAMDARLDPARYQKDITGTCPQEVKAEQATLVKFGVNATPSFFINGRFMAGAMPAEEFEKLIDEEMLKANAAIANGVKAERYYDQEIIAKGLTELAPAQPQAVAPTP